MADDIVLSTNIGQGAKMRTLDDGTREWAASVTCYATTVSAGGNVLSIVTATNGLPVAQQGTWTVTANAGTNLNTSTLALETGGNLATIATRTPALGQALAAASVPIVLTAAQLTTLTPLTTITTVTTVSAVTSITNALPAGTNLLGQISASNETGTIYNGTTAITPLFAVISASSSGATTIVGAQAGKKIRVLKWSLSANGAVNVKWQSHVTPTDLTGLHYMTQFSTAGGAYCQVGHFQTVAGEALDINLSGSAAVGGELTYILV